MKKILILIVLLITANLNLFANLKYINYKSFPDYDLHWDYVNKTVKIRRISVCFHGFAIKSYTWELFCYH